MSKRDWKGLYDEPPTTAELNLWYVFIIILAITIVVYVVAVFL